jgi:hypothetical protein
LKSALNFFVINYNPACKRVGVQACKGESVHKNGAECVVLGAVFSFFAS